MSSNPVGWFEIYVKDMPRAKAFYEKVFGVTLQKLDTPAGDVSEMWSFPMSQNGAGAAGALVSMTAGPSGSGGTVVYFTSEDCAVETGRVTGAGGSVMKDKFSIGQYGFISLVVDPEGNVVGIHSRR